MLAPLDDPTYRPATVPVGGKIPDVVARWGADSQLRWFRRFTREIGPQPHSVWSRFYAESSAHRGLCCTSCIEDREYGYDLASDYCCCEAAREADRRV